MRYANTLCKYAMRIRYANTLCEYAMRIANTLYEYVMRIRFANTLCEKPSDLLGRECAMRIRFAKRLCEYAKRPSRPPYTSGQFLTSVVGKVYFNIINTAISTVIAPVLQNMSDKVVAEQLVFPPSFHTPLSLTPTYLHSVLFL